MISSQRDTTAIADVISGSGTSPRGRVFHVAVVASRVQLAIAGILLSVLFGCHGPAENRVCNHMLDVLGRTDVVSCTASMTTVRERMGRLRYRAYARCVIRAETARAIIECRSNIE